MSTKKVSEMTHDEVLELANADTEKSPHYHLGVIRAWADIPGYTDTERMAQIRKALATYKSSKEGQP